jgi:hypothetical protein
MNGAVNRGVAIETFNATRKFFKNGWKSANKRINVLPDKSNLTKAIDSFDRLKWANKAMDQFGREAAAAKGYAGNCGEMTEYAMKFLASSNGILARRVEFVDPGDHVFCLIGRCDSSALTADMTKWPEHLWVVDPWANICCKAMHWPEVFRDTCVRWSSIGLEICYKNNWAKPNKRYYLDAIGCNKIVTNSTNNSKPKVQSSSSSMEVDYVAPPIPTMIAANPLNIKSKTDSAMDTSV